MNWIILCLLSSILYSFSGFIDNFITDVILKGKKPQTVKVLDGFIYLIIAIIIGLVFGVKSIPIEFALLAVLCGVITSTASLPYYQALKTEETTTATIFYQLIPICYMIADFFVLGTTPTTKQLIGFFVILIAPVVVIMSRKSKKSKRIELLSTFMFLLFVVISSASGVIFAKIEQQNLDFMTLFFYVILGRAALDLTLTAFRKDWRKDNKEILKKNAFLSILVIAGTLILSLGADFILRYSFTLTATSLASVVSNAGELIVTFIFGIILTLIWPKFGRENLSKHVILSHLIATILCVSGIILLN